MKQTELALALIAASTAIALPAVAADSLTEAIQAGKAGLDFRLRYEDVDQANKDDTNAFTLRSRLNYKTGDFNGFTAFGEVDNTTAIGNDEYNTAPNDNTYPDKAVIADPEITQVNQVWLNYHVADSDFKYGRQRINLDNQRHVGGVGFRQNEQTYDGFTASTDALENFKLSYSYVYRVHRIFGDDNPISTHNVQTNLLNAAYSGWSLGKLTAYYYGIENDNVSKFSTTTAGLRFAGSTGDETKFTYALEFAQQSDAKNNTRDYKANYYLAEAGVNFQPVTLKVGYEVLGADGENGEFITSLATLHKFQGWTDKFLNLGAGNITGGIKDAYGVIGGTVSGVKLSAVYHQFKSDDSSASEI
ncbi:MAG: alginate export family protein, partial [Pseudomonadales bacterium]